MIDTILNWFLTFDFTGRMGLMLYWLPVVICAQGYLVRTVTRYQACLRARDANQHFHSDTVGTLIARAFATFCPIFNLMAAICDLGPKLLAGLFDKIEKAFDRPLVKGN